MKKVSKGRVDYGDIPELKDVHLNKYRKDPITSWTILGFRTHVKAEV